MGTLFLHLTVLFHIKFMEDSQRLLLIGDRVPHDFESRRNRLWKRYEAWYSLPHCSLAWRRPTPRPFFQIGSMYRLNP
jgi:hypothetical protein